MHLEIEVLNKWTSSIEEPKLCIDIMGGFEEDTGYTVRGYDESIEELLKIQSAINKAFISLGSLATIREQPKEQIN